MRICVGPVPTRKDHQGDADGRRRPSCAARREAARCRVLYGSGSTPGDVGTHGEIPVGDSESAPEAAGRNRQAGPAILLSVVMTAWRRAFAARFNSNIANLARTYVERTASAGRR